LGKDELLISLLKIGDSGRTLGASSFRISHRDLSCCSLVSNREERESRALDRERARSERLRASSHGARPGKLARKRMKKVNPGNMASNLVREPEGKNPEIVGNKRKEFSVEKSADEARYDGIQWRVSRKNESRR
jgi:hypothetical protein